MPLGWGPAPQLPAAEPAADVDVGFIMTGSCAVCLAPATQCCSGCRSVFYCGRDHQRQHWKVHKSECLMYRVSMNDTLGRYLEATRDIKPGEVIIQEQPLVVGPKVASEAVCLGCLKKVPEKDWLACEGCGWPLCTSECESLSQHKVECRLMRERKYRAEFELEKSKKEPAYSSIVPLRCLLLKERDPAKYQVVLAMESHVEERKKSPVYNVYKHNIAGFIKNALNMAQFDEETILQIAFILDTNSFEIRKGNVKGRGLYQTASLMAHDCVPNTKHIFKGAENTIKILATVPIKKGEIISTSYTQSLWGTLARRSHVKTSKCFDCACHRCSDPTELGTYLGAIACSQCRIKNKGSDVINKIISTSPLDMTASWKCEICSYTLPARQISWGNEAMKQEISFLTEKTPEALEQFLEKYGDALHPKNSHVIQVKYALNQIYGNAPGYNLSELSDKLLSRKIDLCHELLEVADILTPGMTRLRGSVLYDLQAAMVVNAKRNFYDEKITKMAAQDIMGDAMKILQEAAEILRQEPDKAEDLQEKLKVLADELEEIDSKL